MREETHNKPGTEILQHTGISSPSTLKSQKEAGTFITAGDPLQESQEQLPASQVTDMLKQAVAFQDQGRFNNAIDLCEQILESGIDRPDAHYFLGLLYQEQQRWDEAIHQFQRLLNNPDYALSSFYALGQCYQAKGDFRSAALHFDEAAARVNLDALKREEADQFIQFCQEAAETHRLQGDQETFLMREEVLNEPDREILGYTQRKFGSLLRQVCEIGGFTAGKLSQEVTAEFERLREQRSISSNAPVGSLGPFTLCRIMAGTQAPSYYQVFLCLAVLGKHLNSQRFAEICQELDIEIPDLGKKWKRWEQNLWHLAGFLSPDELAVLYKRTKDLQLIEIYPLDAAAVEFSRFCGESEQTE